MDLRQRIAHEAYNGSIDSAIEMVGELSTGPDHAYDAELRRQLRGYGRKQYVVDPENPLRRIPASQAKRKKQY